MSLVISTQDVAPAERLAMWGELLWRQFRSLVSPAYAGPQFDGRLVFSELADLRLCRIDATRHRVLRTPREVRRDDRGSLKVVAQLHGSASFEQAGRRVVLRTGEWSIYDTSRSYVVTNPASVSHLVLLLPRERVRALGVRVDQVATRRFPGCGGASGLAFERLVAAFDGAPAKAQADRAADQLAELIGMAILERAGIESDCSLRASARDRVRAYVDANLRDPAMTLDDVAAAVGCSKRNLHKLFRDEGETLAAHIWQARLARIREDLSAPALRSRSITEIAFAWGFSSAAHFSRSFRERYGLAPRGYRDLVAAARARRRTQ
jgi:AraC-like DNA-binding protein